eukprot:Gb_24448 [translate_table: standard]
MDFHGFAKEQKMRDVVPVNGKGIAGDAGSVVEEIAGFLRVYKDGSVDRLTCAVSHVPPSTTPNETVASVDEVLNAQSGVWARIYLPQKVQNSNSRRRIRLPVLIYFHGGGFCMASASWSIYHVFLCRLASEANSIIISVNYRLAPEHRLPVQYDDGFKAVQWVRQQALMAQTQLDPGQVDDNGSHWVLSYGDFSRCFLAGDSSGANIVHNVAARITGTAGVTKPLEIRGAILIQPFFSGMNYSKWESEEFDPGLPQHWIDVYWRLALPVGANRDHPACNPLGKDSPEFNEIQLPPMLLCIAELDAIQERNFEYYEALKKAGKNVRLIVNKGVGHAFQVLDPASHRTPELIKHMAEFINQQWNSSIIDSNSHVGQSSVSFVTTHQTVFS